MTGRKPPAAYHSLMLENIVPESQSRLVVTLSFGDVTLDWLTVAMLMASEIPLKIFKSRGLNYSQ